MAIKELPFDIYVQIFKQLPVSAQTDEGPRTLAACLRANSILRSAASIATLWEPHYHERYTLSVPANELARKQAFGNDWKSLYLQRIRLDRQAIKILNDIIMERDARLERAREVTSTLSYDVWNALATEAQCPVPEQFRGVNDSKDGEVPRHAIPRRFWARSLLGTIARSHAVRTWCAIRDKEEYHADTLWLETAIACLSSYFAHPPMEVSNARNAPFSKPHDMVSCRFRLNSIFLATSVGHILQRRTFRLFQSSSIITKAHYAVYRPQSATSFGNMGSEPQNVSYN